MPPPSDCPTGSRVLYGLSLKLMATLRSPMDQDNDPGSPADGIFVSSEVIIPDREIHFTFSRSGGPGGQNVNKVNTRVTLLFEPENSSALTPEQVARIKERLASRMGSDGVLRVISQQSRSQSANREAARERFARILAEALYEQPQRRDTRPPRRAARVRIEEKRLRGRLKQSRRYDWTDE